MKFMSVMTNELPFMLEIPNGMYSIKTSTGIVDIAFNSDMFNLYVARFPEFSGKTKYVGEKEELQKTIMTQNLPNYAFDECKTFVSLRCSSEKDFSEMDYSNISRDDCIEKIKTNLLLQNVEYVDSNDLSLKAVQAFEDASEDELHSLREQILIEKEFSTLHRTDAYYEALNIFIRQYAYLRKHFWVHKVDENILEGTLIQDYLNGKFYSSITRAGLAPSIMPARRKYPDISAEDKAMFNDRLINNGEIPIEEDLVLVARSLWYRLEYRSAIIESSAALEIAVEKKLVEKMKARGKDEAFIADELKKTEVNFNQRCDVYLKRYTGKSFITDNANLWGKIDQHRKDYRHKISHSTVNPDRSTTVTIINDFEQAIQYISTL